MSQLSSPAPRRSQRDRKQAKNFISVQHPSKKRRRQDVDSASDEEMEDLADEMPSSEDSDTEKDDAYKAAPVVRKTAARGRGRPKGSVATTRKPRVAKAKAPSRPKKIREVEEDAAADTPGVAKDVAISDDNVLFNALLNPSAALQSTAEDFLDSFEQSAEPALADVINCILRACGCNASVNSDEATDSDGVVDTLETLMEDAKKQTTQPYPLVSKLPAFRKFRRSISELFHRLVSASAELGILYDSDLIPTLQTWLVPMSSAQLRSFRHTATVIALDLESALAEVAAEVEKEAEVVRRQLDAERKKRGGGRAGKATPRENELEGKAQEVKARRTKMTEYLKEFFDGVFMNRYRDHDPGIRAECVHEMGVWLKKHPAHFLDGNYLRYVGWVLSDTNTHVRLEAVKALTSLYAKPDYLVSLHHFTERFKPRLVKMATSDVDVAVRVAVIGVLGAIEAQGLLEEEQREQLCLLVFDTEAKVRRAVAGPVRTVWEEAVAARLVGKKAGAKEKQRAGVKSLAELLLRWAKALERGHGGIEQEESQEEGPEKPKEIAALMSGSMKGRVALCVEALWDEVEAVQDWEALLEQLLMDHSAEVGSGVGGPSPVSKRRKMGKKKADDNVVDEVWRLEEVEEAVLLEVLLAALRKALAEAQAGKKSDEEAVQTEMTRVLIKALPRLFVKHQSDEGRIADVLLIPQLMNLDMYLEMSLVTAYETLWDDVSKQFLSHSSSTVLQNAISTIRHLVSATSLSNTNSSKIVELEDELSSSLRDAIAGRHELEIVTFTEDEVHALGAIAARIATLFGSRDLTRWMEEDEGGKQSSAWDIISALAERGRLGDKQEEKMIDQVLQILALHITWKARGLTAEVDPPPEQEQFRESLREQRDSLLEKLTEYAVGSQSTPSEGVKRAAFHSLLSIHILFGKPPTLASGNLRSPLLSLPLEMAEDVQLRCAAFVQAEIERYAEELEQEADGGGKSDGDDTVQGESDSEEDEGRGGAKQKKAKKAKKAKAKKVVEKDGTPDPPTLSQHMLEREYIFSSIASTFLRAIRTGAIDVQHCVVLLAHFGRLGTTFDQCAKVIVEVLREEGMYKGNGEAVAQVITQALQESFDLYMDGSAKTEAHSIALAKALAAALVIRGAHLSITRRLDSPHVVEIHEKCMSWILKRIAGYENNKNKTMKAKAIEFFRVLLPLLLTVERGEAQDIKKRLDSEIELGKFEISATSKVWEPQRAYEKRLVTALSKSLCPTTAAPGRGKKAAIHKSAEQIATDDERDHTDAPDVGMSSPPRPPPRPKPRPKARPTRKGKTTPDAEAEADRDGQEQEPTSEAPVTDAEKPVAARNSASSSPLSDAPPSRKRPRDEGDDENAEVAGDGGEGERRDALTDLAQHQPTEQPSSPGSQASISEFKSRRKRARR
ncbi:hypothetical protein BOTBODRAFT_119941 [Botryobasidium botryosum FD-172 SS1]|uniref:SCD domain-containing protein n=1 Tax=Botryobasidium botryosum (strain FD-172 SS1) TaxID=930990 RepID=A0A067LYR8_BOTB1|nr:hypothetical protein BOTBODRAFT_119941 [Botryobasidium botryosum FD-172 SS1]